MRFQEKEAEVLDHQNALIWMKQVKTGLTFDEAQAYALQVARETGQPWRLPTIDELGSLIDRSRCNPASGFPDMLAIAFWSSSPYVGNPNGAWSVVFSNGNVSYYSRDYSLAVRLVRDNYV